MFFLIVFVRGYYDIVECLVEYGVDFNVCDKDGYIVFYLVVRWCQMEVIKIFFS